MSGLLRTKRIAWALALFLATLVLTFSYVSGRRYLNAVDWVGHTEQVAHHLEALLSETRQLESGARGYVITGDPTFLEEHAAGQRSLARSLSLVRGLVRDNPQEVARVARLERALHDKLGFMAGTIAVRQRGDQAEAERRIASLRGKQLMGELYAVVAEMEREEARLLGQRSSAAARTQHETIAAIAGGSLVMLALLVLSFLSMQRDARELRDAAAELAESEERYRVLVENVSDLVAIHGPNGELKFVSPSVEAFLGRTPAEIGATSVFNLLHPEDMASARYNLEKFQAGEAQSGVVTCRLRRRDGEYRWFEFKIARVNAEDGSLLHFQSAGRDVTVRRQLEQRLAEQAEELRHLSLRDGLTGLYNRRGFLELSAQVVRVAEREKHPVALLFIDLDRLKLINDQLGHGHGDRAITETAELLRASCRATDLVARLGGDEFVVLASNLDGGSVNILKGRLARALEQANRKPGRDYELSFSLGVATFDPLAPVPIESLLVAADLAMYEAKAGRQRSRSRLATVSSVA